MVRASTVVLVVAELVIWGAYLWPWYNLADYTTTGIGPYSLGGLPFFYWWPLLMFPVSALLLLAYAFASERGRA